MEQKSEARPGSHTAHIKEAQYEATARLMLRSMEPPQIGLSSLCVEVKMDGRKAGVNGGFIVQCIGTGGPARGEFGAYVSLASGELEIMPFRTGFRGYSAHGYDTVIYKSECEAVPAGDGAFSLKPKGEEVPVDITITKDGVAVGDRFVRFATLYAPVEELKRA